MSINLLFGDDWDRSGAMHNMAHLVRAHFDDFAPLYDSAPWAQTYAAPARVFALAKIFAGNATLEQGRILDIGCGTGLNAVRFRQAFQDATILGVDYAANMLGQARLKSVGGRPVYDRVRLRDTTAEGAFRDLGQFDAVIESGSLEFMPALQGVFDNVAKVLKPDAPFVFTTKPAVTPQDDFVIATRGHECGIVQKLVENAGMSVVHESEQFVSYLNYGHYPVAYKAWVARRDF